MLNKSWKRIIGNTIEWSAFCLVNKERQKYEWNKITYSEICTILCFEKKNSNSKSSEHFKIKIKPNILFKKLVKAHDLQKGCIFCKVIIFF